MVVIFMRGEAERNYLVINALIIVSEVVLGTVNIPCFYR